MTRSAIPPVRSVGSLIRRHREVAQLSLRELARLSEVSNAYLSQVERGLHEPSVRVLNAIADALSVPVEELVLGRATEDPPRPVSPQDVERTIRGDSRLSTSQQEALLTVYRSYLAQGSNGEGSSGSRG